MNRIGIFGTSGMAREAGDIAWELGYEPIYVARDQVELEAWSFPGQVILESDVNRYLDMSYVIGIGDNFIRQHIAQRYAEHLHFASLIHPTASFGKGQRQLIEAKRGVIVCAGVRFTNNIEVGDFCIFNLNATISHDTVIDECVYVAPGAHITGNVHVGTRSWIGTGVAINQGSNIIKLRVGADTTIGSGAVVVKDCEANAVYAGVPARRIK
jgi:sugar O-acyltransferase (sialic acid O-acetyltransferase NeuD family)